MKLFVDDIRHPPDDTWNIARDVSSAIRAVDMFGSEIAFINLDHDISHQVVVGKMSRPYPCTETFEAVARYLALYKRAHPDFSPIIIIHTSNPVGLKNMRNLLNDAGFLVEAELARGANRLEMEV